MRLFGSMLCCTLLLLPLAPGKAASSQPTEVEPIGERIDGTETSPIFDAAHAMASLSVGGTTLSPLIKQAMFEQVLQGFALDSGFQELEQQFPGVTIAVVDAIMAFAARQTEETMPALISRLAILYAEELTSDEIEVATKWYSSSAYSRVLAAMEENLDSSELFQAGLADTKFQINNEDLETIEKTSVAHAVPALGLEDKAALLQFSKTVAFTKIEALKPQTRAIEARWSNENDPHHDAEMERVTINALEAFTGLDLSE